MVSDPVASNGDVTDGVSIDAQMRAGQIITAAYDMLADDGLDGLTVRAVLRVTGFNRRTFYEHFADKDQLVLAVFARSIGLVTTQCRQRIAAIADPLERLRFIVEFLSASDIPELREFGRNARRSSALCREHVRLAEARPKDLQIALRPLIELIAEQIADGIETGQVRTGDPYELANLVYNLVSTTVHAVLIAPEPAQFHPVERARLSQQIWAFCKGGVAA